MSKMVTAKRLGWDNKVAFTELDELEEYDYPTDDLSGELVVIDVDEAPGIDAHKTYLVGGQIADPKTIKDQDDTPVTANHDPLRSFSKWLRGLSK
jgi:hypothetical protein